MKTIFPQFGEKWSSVHVLKTTTTRYMVGSIDFYFHFLANFASYVLYIYLYVMSRVTHSKPGLPNMVLTGWVHTRFARHNQCTDVIEDEKAILHVFIGLRKAKEGKNNFDKKWAAKLAESDWRSFYNQECWMNSTTIVTTKPKSKPKWGPAAVKYCCKRLSKQRKMMKKSGWTWKGDRWPQERHGVAAFMSESQRGIWDQRSKAYKVPGSRITTQQQCFS